MATDKAYNDKTSKELKKVHAFKQPKPGTGPTDVPGLPHNTTGTAAKAEAAGRKAAARAK